MSGKQMAAQGWECESEPGEWQAAGFGQAVLLYLASKEKREREREGEKERERKSLTVGKRVVKQKQMDRKNGRERKGMKDRQ